MPTLQILFNTLRTGVRYVRT